MTENTLTQAARLLQSGDAAGALSMARTLFVQPNAADARTIAGIAAQQLGQDSEAIAHLESARQADAENPVRHANLAVALKRAGNFDGALAAFERALALRPDHPATLANFGGCLISADRAHAALDPLRRALALQPGLRDAQLNLAIALARTGGTAEAIGLYKAMVAARADDHEARINLADALAGAGDPDAALEELGMVPSAHPAFLRAANQKALIHERAGRFDLAIATLGPLWDAGNTHHALAVNLARLLIRAGREEEALFIAARASELSPDNTSPLALRYAALSRLDRQDELAALAALDDFVTVRDFDRVPGFASVEAFDAALIEELAAHPSLVFEPAGLVTTQGRQSDDLADAASPAMAALAKLARKQIAKEHRRLDDLKMTHPFLAARPQDWTLTMWGTILNPGGEVGAHVHAPNWLSGVYYPAFRSEDCKGEGGFAIGPLSEELGGGGHLTIYAPRAGRMILFPSFLWHSTLPFGGDHARVSFAFDCVPKGTGRPHRLAKAAGRVGNEG